VAAKKDVMAHVISGDGGIVELSSSMREKMVIFSDGSALINENSLNDADVIAKIAILSHMKSRDGDAVLLKDKIQYVDPMEIHSFYLSSTVSKFTEGATQIQLDIVELIKNAVRRNATDIHIVVETAATYVSLRVIGDLVQYQTLTSEHGVLLCTTLYNTMTTTSGTNFNPRTQQDANIQESFLPSNLSGIRVASSPTQGGNFFMVLRLLPKGSKTNIAILGYAKHQLEKLEKFKSRHNGGITICAGPTGSGKSTLLQAITKSILLSRQGRINLITIEDPVEYPIVVEETINNKKLVYSARQISIPSTQDRALRQEYFHNAIVASMRQDPDVIMIGEIRDKITTEAALTASITGHSIITTLHANNAIMIIDRLLNMEATKSILLAPKTLTGLISQHLVPVLCPKCKKAYNRNKDSLDNSFVKRLESALGGKTEGVFLRGHGCNYVEPDTNLKCINGAITRTVIAEIIEPDKKFLMKAFQGNLFDLHDYWIDELKGITMMCHGLVKVYLGIVDPRDLEDTLEEITPQRNFEFALENN
jgi:type II secretory ATPase GspE/PulE/Tfp pilus assembly ATPase PilB-like protein